MRPKLRFHSIGSCIIFITAAMAGAVMSTQDYMENNLPVYNRYRCGICHTSMESPTSLNLNTFGNDFRANAYVWNTELAGKDSDGDGYPNGIELGDDQGEWRPSTSVERSNPGDGFDTPNSIERKTWSIIKSLFE